MEENDSDSCVEIDQEEEVIIRSLASKLPPEFVTAWKKLPQYDGQFIGFMMYMLKYGLHADVQFLLQTKTGPMNRNEPTTSKSKSTEFISAHQSILKTKSVFFDTLFSERWSKADGCNEIDLTASNVEADCFRNFLQFLYVGQTAFTRMNVLQLYYLSDLYQVDDLKAKCETFLVKNLNDENVFDVLEAVLTYDHERTSKVLTDVVRFFNGQGHLLDRKEFKNMDEKMLAHIFFRVNFQCKPLKMMRFILGWIIRNRGKKFICDTWNLDWYVRQDLNVRYNNEIPSLHSFNMPQAVDDPTKEYEVSRFRSVSKTKSWTYREGRADRISFKVSDTVHLTGIGLYTKMENAIPSLKRTRYSYMAQRSNYSVTVSIYIHGKQHRILAQVSKEIDLQPEKTENQPPWFSPSQTFKVPFDLEKPMYAYSGELYTIAVTIEGPSSFCGEKGITEELLMIGDTPVIFEFVDASDKDHNATLANPTGVPIGQIPIIYCKMPANNDKDDELQIL